MGDLRFDHEQNARVTEARVRPEQHEEVGEARHRHAEVGLDAALPLLGERTTVTSGDLQVRVGTLGVEAGGEHERVEFVDGAFFGDDAVGHDGDDRLGDDADVLAHESGVVGVGEDDALAPHCVIGGEFAAQVRVLHLVLEVARRFAGGDLEQLGVAVERDGAQIVLSA